MPSVSLITRPRRAVALVALVGLLFGTHGGIVLGWPQAAAGRGVAGDAAACVLVAALIAAAGALSVLAALHSRLGTAGISIARAGLAGPGLAAVGSLALGQSTLSVLSWAGAIVAAPGMAAIVVARRGEADLPAGLLEAALLATFAAPLVAGHGGCLLAGAAWAGLAAALGSVYLAPATGLHRHIAARSRTLRLPAGRRSVKVTSHAR